jgi:hypothetical protein
MRSRSEVESPLSQASLVRQVAREGARWRLAPVVDEKTGRVRVAESVPAAEARHGVGEVVRRPDRVLCTITDETPFSEVFVNRIENGETDLARRYKALDEQERREKAAEDAEKEAETLRIWGSRRRITALPSGIIPAGLTNRWRR